MDELQQLKEKLKEYEKRMGIGSNDPARDGYMVYVKILRQQNEFLDTFEIKDEISKTTKEDATYGRAKDMWENLPKMIENVNNLKVALKIEGEEKKTQERPLSASDIANGKF